MKLLDDKGDIADLVKYRLDVAKQDLADARLLFEHNSLLSANNRIYYAVFHAINAVHALDGNGYKRHKDAIAKFNENYVATGIFPREYGRMIHRAENLRHNSDYDDFSIVDADITLELMNVMEKIVHEIEKYLLARI